MRLTFWIGRRCFCVGRIFDAGAPAGFRHAGYSPRLDSFNLGRYGALVIRFRGRVA